MGDTATVKAANGALIDLCSKAWVKPPYHSKPSPDVPLQDALLGLPEHLSAGFFKQLITKHKLPRLLDSLPIALHQPMLHALLQPCKPCEALAALPSSKHTGGKTLALPAPPRDTVRPAAFLINFGLGGSALSAVLFQLPFLPLSSFSLTDHGLGDEDMSAAIRAVSLLHNLLHLDLSGNSAAACAARMLGQALPSLPHLLSLDLSGSVFEGAEAADDIAHGLRLLHALTRVEVPGMQGTARVRDALKGLPSLHKLSMSNRGAGTVLPGCTQLRTLLLWGSADGTQGSDQTSLADALGTCTNLRRLALRDVYLGKQSRAWQPMRGTGWQPPEQLPLGLLSQLTHLDLQAGSHGCAPHAAQAGADSARGMWGLPGLATLSTLQHLHFGDSIQLSSAVQQQVIAAALAHMPHMRYLAIAPGCVQARDRIADCTELARGFASVPGLQALTCSVHTGGSLMDDTRASASRLSTLVALSLTVQLCTVQSHDAVKLQEQILSLQQLQHLRLRCTYTAASGSDTFCWQLFHSLQRLLQLQGLYIKNADLRADGKHAMALPELPRTLTALTSFELDGCKLPERFVTSVHCGVLKVLKVVACQLQPEHIRLLYARIEEHDAHQRLRHLSFEQNCIDADVLEWLLDAIGAGGRQNTIVKLAVPVTGDIALEVKCKRWNDTHAGHRMCVTDAVK